MTLTTCSKPRWSEEEDQLFDQLYKKYKNNFREIARNFKTRTYSQIRSHYYNLQNREDKNKNNITQSQTVQQFVQPHYSIQSMQSIGQQVIRDSKESKIKVIDSSVSVPSMLGTQ
ncbi:SANT/Myb_domain [Hexamita inflata]|uniref:SANT/Myb domain n=1 Tax=Hexamita inflata TaxID=28002 RepID=A0AA86NLN9_9EUKA|nr:SANT/Myb domain [Hexamita inflata]